MDDNRLNRLITGFTPLGFNLFANHDGISYEFRRPETALRFVIRSAEGGVVLLWTKSNDFDLIQPSLIDIFRNIPPDVELKTFSESVDFWQTVEDIVALDT